MLPPVTYLQTHTETTTFILLLGLTIFKLTWSFAPDKLLYKHSSLPALAFPLDGGKNSTTGRAVSLFMDKHIPSFTLITSEHIVSTTKVLRSWSLHSCTFLNIVFSNIHGSLLCHKFCVWGAVFAKMYQVQHVSWLVGLCTSKRVPFPSLLSKAEIIQLFFMDDKDDTDRADLVYRFNSSCDQKVTNVQLLLVTIAWLH